MKDYFQRCFGILCFDVLCNSDIVIPEIKTTASLTLEQPAFPW
jgi:hypothetical protein